MIAPMTTRKRWPAGTGATMIVAIASKSTPTGSPMPAFGTKPDNVEHWIAVMSSGPGHIGIWR
jgi:hypothetical protein